MAKPAEPDIATRTAPTIVQVKLRKGESYFNAPPFPSINAPARSRANVFNRWETAVLSQMNMGIPVQELMAQLDQHLPIENTSAQMKADAIGYSIYASFLKTSSIQGLCFVDQDHEEMVFENSWMRDRPTGIEFFRVRSTVDLLAIHAYIKEPGFTTKFDLSLAQTHLVPPFSATVTENPKHTTPINLFDLPSLQMASPALVHCIVQYH
jgi:hypothetical protein